METGSPQDSQLIGLLCYMGGLCVVNKSAYFMQGEMIERSLKQRGDKEEFETERERGGGGGVVQKE